MIRYLSEADYLTKLKIVSIALPVITVLIAVIYPVFMNFSQSNLTTWFNILISTFISVSLASSFALYLYYRRILDDKSKKLELLSSYLRFLIDKVPEHEDIERVNMGYINNNLINSIINTGYFEYLYHDLIYLQGYIQFFMLIRNQIIENKNLNKQDPDQGQRSNILQSQELIRDKAKECLKLLQKRENIEE